MKPVIAISAQTAVASSKHFGEQRITGLYDLYVNAIQQAGGLPVVVAHGEPADVSQLLDRFDALVLPGGGDIDPTTYGDVPDAENLYGMRPESDLFEIAMVREAAKQRVPVLGICRGLQVINVAFGGTLHQDLPEHPQDLAARAFAPHYRTAVLPGSRLHQVVGRDEIVVNSLHHQGVKDVGDGLRVAAIAHDGVVESVEAEHVAWDMLAVQWHPECLRKEHATALFDWLIAAAAMRATQVDLHTLTESVRVIPVKRKTAAAS